MSEILLQYHRSSWAYLRRRGAAVVWDEDAGRVSQAFNEWFVIDGDQRHFLHLGLTYIRDTLDRLWDAIATSPMGGDGIELPDAFEAETGGLYPQDFEWMHAAGVVKDAVTNFEVYLEKAREEAHRAHGDPLIVTGEAPAWRQLQEFYARLGVTLPPPAVRHVRELRHVLAHRRGELRTEDQRRKFAAGDGVWDDEVTADETSVVAIMDTLAAEVRSIDPLVYDHARGGRRLASD